MSCALVATATQTIMPMQTYISYVTCVFVCVLCVCVLIAILFVFLSFAYDVFFSHGSYSLNYMR